MTTPIIERKPTQREAVLDALRQAGSRGVCLADVPLDLGYTMRNRIASLRREYTIRGERCTVHKHRGQVERYYIQESRTRPQPQVSCTVDHQGMQCPGLGQMAFYV